jgi:hypothetical protein
LFIFYSLGIFRGYDECIPEGEFWDNLGAKEGLGDHWLQIKHSVGEIDHPDCVFLLVYSFSFLDIMNSVDFHILDGFMTVPG